MSRSYYISITTSDSNARECPYDGWSWETWECWCVHETVGVSSKCDSIATLFSSILLADRKYIRLLLASIPWIRLFHGVGQFFLLKNSGCCFTLWVSKDPEICEKERLVSSMKSSSVNHDSFNDSLNHWLTGCPHLYPVHCHQSPTNQIQVRERILQKKCKNDWKPLTLNIKLNIKLSVGCLLSWHFV